MKLDHTIIIGGGPSGIAAATYLKRFSHPVTILEPNGFLGGQVIVPHRIENYLGFPEGVGGFEFAELLQKQIVNLEIPIIHQSCIKIEKQSSSLFSVHLDNKEVLEVPFVIFAVGTRNRLLNIPGEASLKGRGVSTCATCDGPFFKNKTIAVIGGGDTALTETLYLSTYASSIHLFHRRDEFRGFSLLAKKIMEEPKITIHYSSVPLEILGEETVKEFVYEDLKKNEKRTLSVDGVFIFAGYIPDPSPCGQLVELDEKQYIKTESNKETRTEGLYAVGDINSKPLRQIITAMSDGAIAAHDIHHKILNRS